MTDYVYPDPLETRYRRLLAVYPARYRARYGEEMIDVLMASSVPGQRRPDRREALDLVVSGLRARFGGEAGGGLSPASRTAASVYGFLASIALAALSWYQVAASVAWRGVLGAPGSFAQLPHRSLAMGVVWTLVAVACVVGLRWVAALGAVLGFLGEVVVVGRGYDFAPNIFVASWWLVTLTGFVAAGLASLVGRAPGGWRGVLRRDTAGVRPLGWRAVVALLVGAALMVAEPLVDRAMTDVEPVANGVWVEHGRFPDVALPGFIGGYGGIRPGALILVVTVVVLVLRLSPAVRRRVLVLAAPTAAVALVIQLWFQGFMQSSPRFDPPVYLTFGQWGALVLVPLLVFATGTWLVHRYERQLASGALLA